MNKVIAETEKRILNWFDYTIAFIAFLLFDLLMLSLFPNNRYSDLSFVLIVFFGFKLLGFESIHIFLYSVPYFMLVFAIIISNSRVLTFKFLDSMTFYIPSLLALAFLAYIYEEKFEKKFIVNKKIALSFFIYFIVAVFFIASNTFYCINDAGIIIKINNLKESVNRIFNKSEYYSKKDYIITDGVKVNENIIVLGSSPKKKVYISGKVILAGWAIEKNSIYDSGIDSIELYLNGKAGEGKYLGKFTQNYKAEFKTKNYISNLYINFFGRLPTDEEIKFWAINLEYQNMSYSEVANNIIRKSGFMEGNLSNEDFLGKLYDGLLWRKWDEGWIDRLETDLSREDLLYIVINSKEFNDYSDIYYDNVPHKEKDLGIIRKDVGEKYGKQFLLSGFELEFDSTDFPDGEHELYFYAHSPVFGWRYKTVKLIINN